MKNPVSKTMKHALRMAAEGRVTHGITGWRVDGALQDSATRTALAALLDGKFIAVMGRGAPLAVTVPKGRDALHAWFSQDVERRSRILGMKIRREGQR